MLVVLIATGAIVKDYVLARSSLPSSSSSPSQSGAEGWRFFLFRLSLSHGHLLGHDDASAERRRSLGSFALACRTCMPICLFAAVFATTTKIGDLTAALYGMRLPKTVVVPLVIAVRFFPTLKEESSAVADAMRVRGSPFRLRISFRSRR